MKTDKFKIVLFGLVMIVFFVTGLLIFLRPTVSETEKRTLAEFPKFTLSSFLSGEYTSKINTWYADTYPARDALIEADNAVKSLRGSGSVINSDGEGDTIPDINDDTQPIEEATGKVDIKIDREQSGETVGGFYLVGDTAYELYYFNKTNSDNYAALVNRAASQLDGKAEVYDLIVPLSYSIYLSKDTQKSLKVSDCEEAINYMYGKMSNKVKKVDAFSVLAQNNSEYLYYRTDHHWTARGAYRAYTAFCKQAGITATPLESYKKYEFEGFLGTLYADTKQPAAMKNNPDVVEAFVPIATNSIEVTERGGNKQTYQIVNTATDKWYQAASSKYNCFIAGDNPLSVIKNPNKTDGSAILVIKESFGNAFVPFLTDNYQYVYVVDYRKYGDMTLSEFVSTYNVDTVLFINNMIATSASARLAEMSDFIN